MTTDILVVGAGFFGLTIAERAASAGLRVTVIDRREHLGGNAYSYRDAATGIEVHQYGSHIFHTSNEPVWEYVNRFTTFTPYEHRVYTTHGGEVFPMPINLGTINQFFRTALSPTEARQLIESQAAEVTGTPRNLEQKAVSLIGRPLYEAFIRGYTMKQWQTDPTELDPSIISRLPVRYTYDNRYFNDPHQGVPTDGYHTWIDRMADHPHIEVQLGVDFLTDGPYSRDRMTGRIPIIYTGPIDRYFGYREGALTWRTLDFDQTTEPVSDYQGTTVMNHADPDSPYTRTHEYRHYHPERDYPTGATIISRETSRTATPDDEPYYPVNTTTDRARLTKYRALARTQTTTHFGGRLGTYQYLDMHMAIAAALTLSRKLNLGD